jgi:3-hydroxyisobutyrate dehydrogenase-like beta-hydroxyacid dehydrogenase
MNQVSIIGCGYMGSALIQALANQGIQLHIWNRTPEKARALARSGVSVADSFGAALTASPMTIFCLSDSDYTITNALLQKEKEKISGKIIVQLSTGDSKSAKQLQEFVDTHGGRYLDGAILVDPALIGTPQGMIIYGGNASTFETAQSILAFFGGKTLLVGEEPGMIGTLDLGLNITIIPMEVGLLQARKLCQLAKNVPIKLFDSLVHTFVTNHLARVLELMQQTTDANVLKSGATVAFFADMTQEISESIRDYNIDSSMFDAISKIYAGGVAGGRGKHDGFCVADLHAISKNEVDNEVDNE